MNISRNQIIFFGFCFHVLAAIFSVGYHHCDELFQVYEFAGYKLGINKLNDLPWEFNEQMRSGLQPLIVYSITRIFYSFSYFNPFHVAMLIRVLQSLFSFVVIVQLFKYYEYRIINHSFKKWMWWGLLFWCLPYFHARFSSENLSITIFIAGLVVLLNNLTQPQRQLYMAGAGFLFGLSFICRFQILFMIAGVIAWLIFINKTQIKYLIAGIVGVTLAAVVGMLIDRWLYGNWTISWWNYLNLNLFKDKASDFGTEPLYYYLTESALQLIPPFSILIIGAVFYYWRRFNLDIITWITVPFIILHFFVPHKELRFLFPVLNFLPLMIIGSLDVLKHPVNKYLFFIIDGKFARFFLAVNIFALMAFTFSPADNISYSLKKIYDITEEHTPIMFYDTNDPYNNMAALNYFRKRSLITLPSDSIDHVSSNNLYYFTEKLDQSDTIRLQQKVFVKKFSNFPVWMYAFNFNGWLDRNFVFSIYKAV